MLCLLLGFGMMQVGSINGWRYQIALLQILTKKKLERCIPKLSRGEQERLLPRNIKKQALPPHKQPRKLRQSDTLAKETACTFTNEITLSNYNIKPPKISWTKEIVVKTIPVPKS